MYFDTPCTGRFQKYGQQTERGSRALLGPPDAFGAAKNTGQQDPMAPVQLFIFWKLTFFQVTKSILFEIPFSAESTMLMFLS